MLEGDEIALEGGGRDGALRRGDFVVRPWRPWTASVRALLRHLEEVGYPYSPRVVGDGAEDIVSFIEGSPAPTIWTDEGLAELGDALRGLHEATSTFVLPAATWHEQWWVRDRGPRSLIGHGDPAPWNVIARDGRPVGLVDWEFAGPVDQFHEVAHCAWLNCQLHDDDVAEVQGLPSAAERARQLRVFLDGYALEALSRARFVDVLLEVALLSAANEAIEAGVTQETSGPGPLWGLTWRARGGAWMVRNRELLTRAIT
jgi:hypothetical protein